MSGNAQGPRVRCRLVRHKSGGVYSILKTVAILLAVILATAQGVPRSPVVAVVTVNEVDAYAQALKGIREQLPEAQVWDARDEAQLRDNLAKSQPALAIAVGSGAAAALERAAPQQLTLIGSVMLASDLAAEGGNLSRFRTTVTIDIPPNTLLAEVARFFPGRKRIGIIRGPLQTDAYMRGFEQAAQRAGLTVESIDCQHPRELVDAFLRLQSRADLVWCPPNPQLYNSATLKPLLVASLTNRLPIIGFSEQFVQAGALFGGAADYAEVGRQTASLALRVTQNEPVPPREAARKFRFAYNQRVARLLGVKANIPDEAGSNLNIIR